MKKLFFIAIFGLISLMPMALVSSTASAVDVLAPACSVDTGGHGTPAVCVNGGKADTVNPVYTILQIVIQILAVVVGVASIITIIVQGLRILVSNGDPHTVEGARNGILYACFGVILAVFSQIIVSFVLKRFTT